MRDSPGGESKTAEEDEPLSTATEPQLLNRAEEPPPVSIDPFEPSDTLDGSEESGGLTDDAYTSSSEANTEADSCDEVSSGSSADLNDDVSESDTPHGSELSAPRGRG